MALELVSGTDFFVQLDERGEPGQSKEVPGAISAAQTPKIDDLRPVKKSEIKNPGVPIHGSPS